MPQLALLIAASMLFLPRVARAQQSPAAQTPAPALTSAASSTPPPLSTPPPTAATPLPSTSLPTAPAAAEPPAEPANPKPVAAPPTPAPPTAHAVKPPPPPAPAIAKKPRVPTDHESVVRHIGIGFLGISDLPLAVAKPVGTKDAPGLSPNDHVVLRSVAAPTLGARIWISRRIGIDTGIGFSYSRGSTSSALDGITADVDKQSVLAFLLHAGVPVVIADVKHMSLLVVPEATFGLARSNVAPIFDDNAPPEAELRGARLDIGVRAGAEIHFGFMGLPSLTLEAGIGLLFKTEWASATVGNQSVSDVSTEITTTSFSDPWDIFGGLANVSARYYF